MAIELSFVDYIRISLCAMSLSRKCSKLSIWIIIWIEFNLRFPSRSKSNAVFTSHNLCMHTQNGKCDDRIQSNWKSNWNEMTKSFSFWLQASRLLSFISLARLHFSVVKNRWKCRKIDCYGNTISVHKTKLTFTSIKDERHKTKSSLGKIGKSISLMKTIREKAKRKIQRIFKWVYVLYKNQYRMKTCNITVDAEAQK